MVWWRCKPGGEPGRHSKLMASSVMVWCVGGSAAHGSHCTVMGADRLGAPCSNAHNAAETYPHGPLRAADATATGIMSGSLPDFFTSKGRAVQQSSHQGP